MELSSDWLIWQLTDSAFPGGGFAHSFGLEAAMQLGEIDGGAGLVGFCRASLLQCARGAGPVAIEAGRGGDLGELDLEYDAFLSTHVANRASKAQGQGFLAAVVRAIGCEKLEVIRYRVRTERLPGHWPVLFGAVCGVLGVREEKLARVLLFVTLRGLVSAAVRLGIVGPMQGQAVQYELYPYGESLVREILERKVTEISQTSPMMELMQGVHDRLYSRLFQS
jgi:urease accessory protein